MCQVDVKSTEHLNYSVGLKDKMEWTLIQAEPYIFAISYTSGIENRSVNQNTGIVSAVVCKLYYTNFVTLHVQESKCYLL